VPSVVLIGLLGLATAAVGTMGGIGGAILLVPLLTFAGATPQQAAPLGLLMVASGSLAAAAQQLDEGLVHHRLGITIECAATLGTVAGALASAAVPARALEFVLAFAAIGAAAASLRPPRDRRTGDTVDDDVPLGEQFASLRGVVELDGRRIAYRAQRLWLGLSFMTVAGVVSGLAGVGGGFIKTPAMSTVMRVPVKVAAATTTFAIGVTAAAGLAVFVAQGRIDPGAGAAVAAGSLAGGAIGAMVQRRVPPRVVSVVLSVVLIGVGVLVLVR
jgi:hypothetical protein